MSDLQIKNLHELKSSNLLTTHETSLIMGGNSTDEAKYKLLLDNFGDVVSGGPGPDTVSANNDSRDFVFDGDGSDSIDSNVGDIVIRRP